MRLVASVIISCVILFSSVSAQALSYTTSAFLEWSFSGAVEGRGFTGGTVMVSDNQGGGGPGGSVIVPEFRSLPGTGTAEITGLHAPNLSSTATLVGSGSAIAEFRYSFPVTPLEEGLSTLTVNYRLQESGTVPLGTSLEATSLVRLSGIGYGLNCSISPIACAPLASIETVVRGDQSLEITRTITGTYTGSQFSTGSLVGLLFQVSSEVRAVPEPASLTLFGLGLAGLVTLRRTFSRS